MNILFETFVVALSGFRAMGLGVLRDIGLAAPLKPSVSYLAHDPQHYDFSLIFMGHEKAQRMDRFLAEQAARSDSARAHRQTRTANATGFLRTNLARLADIHGAEISNLFRHPTADAKSFHEYLTEDRKRAQSELLTQSDLRFGEQTTNDALRALGYNAIAFRGDCSNT